jgi:hypothetical protein
MQHHLREFPRLLLQLTSGLSIGFIFFSCFICVSPLNILNSLIDAAIDSQSGLGHHHRRPRRARTLSALSINFSPAGRPRTLLCDAWSGNLFGPNCTHTLKCTFFLSRHLGCILQRWNYYTCDSISRNLRSNAPAALLLPTSQRRIRIYSTAHFVSAASQRTTESNAN